MTTTETSLNDLVTAYKTNYETDLNQTIPSQRRAFLNVESVQQAVCHKSIEKRLTAARKAVFAMTAGADGLAIIAQEFACPRDDATYYNATCSVAAAGGSSVAAGAQLTSDATGAYYTVDANANEVGGIVTFVVTAEDMGDAPNLEPAVLALSFTSAPAGITGAANITIVNTYGEGEEDLEVWRARVLTAERAAYGGGNAADYRYWAEQTAGVLHAYPYSGKPITWTLTDTKFTFDAATQKITYEIGMGLPTPIFNDGSCGTIGVGDMIEVSGSTLNNGFYTVQTVGVGVFGNSISVIEPLVNEAEGDLVTIINQSQPGDRTVFIEATTANPVPTAGLLDGPGGVREMINYGTDGVYRPSLGDADSTLYVEPVYTTAFYVEVIGLIVDAGLEAACKQKVVDDVTDYLALCRPFITGIDFEMDRRDMITDLSMGKVVQSVLEVYGASSDGILISVISAGGSTVTSYMLNQGEVPVLGKVWSDTDIDWSV